MKWIKSYKLYESNQLDVKSMVNWNLINDLRDLALEYLDKGDTVEEYNVFLNVIPGNEKSANILKSTHWEKNRDDNEESNQYLIYSGYFNHEIDEFDDVINYEWGGGQGSGFIMHKAKIENFIELLNGTFKYQLNLSYSISYEIMMEDTENEKELVNRLKQIYPKENITSVKNIE